MSKLPRMQGTTNSARRGLALTFVLTALLWATAHGLSDKRLCADKDCKGIISIGRGQISYQPGEKGMVAFRKNSPLRIKSKSAGSDPTLWGIEVNGREGYAPKNLIMEERVYVSEKNLIEVDVVLPGSVPVTPSSVPEVPVESTTTQPLAEVNKEEPIVNTPVENVTDQPPQTATPVQEAATIVDGTRLPSFADSGMEMAKEYNGPNASTLSSSNEDEDEYVIDDDDEMGDYDEDELDGPEEDADDGKTTQIPVRVPDVDSNAVNASDKSAAESNQAENVQDKLQNNIKTEAAVPEPSETSNKVAEVVAATNIADDTASKETQATETKTQQGTAETDKLSDNQTEAPGDSLAAQATEANPLQGAATVELTSESQTQIPMDAASTAEATGSTVPAGVPNTLRDEVSSSASITDNVETNNISTESLPTHNANNVPKSLEIDASSEAMTSAEVPEASAESQDQISKVETLENHLNTNTTDSPPVIVPDVDSQETTTTAPDALNIVPSVPTEAPNSIADENAPDVNEVMPTITAQSFDTTETQHTNPTVQSVEPEATTADPGHIYAHDETQYAQSTYGQGSVEQLQPLGSTEAPTREEPQALPSLTPPAWPEDGVKKETVGLFATIMDTVKNILPNKEKAKYPPEAEVHQSDLDRILFPVSLSTAGGDTNNQYCTKPEDCAEKPHIHPAVRHDCECSWKTLITEEFTLDSFVQAMAAKLLEISHLIAFLTVAAASVLFFIFGYYCFCNSSGEGALLSKLNLLESSLLACHKENAILKHNLTSTRQKLASIEDNSFGSNDMVVSLKKELEEELLEKAKLQDQIVTLQKELENAADAGMELNKIVSELLSSQTGDESIISSVEELQRQLNEQQNTILEINVSLAEKSRENSELQLMVAEQNARYEAQISNLQRDNDELEAEKSSLQTRLEDIRSDFDKDITAALEGKNFEIRRLQSEILELNTKVEAEHTKWQTSMAKIEALEECLKNVKRDPNVNITQVIDVANIKADLLDAQKKYNSLKERLELELDARKMTENQLQLATGEVEKLKQDFNEAEKDKLEAQTRLEVLSNYFKDKENQLQKELSLKETMWLKQQGETTTTVDRLTTMQEEIQSLKSQNDALRAEIEAQVAAHKAQTGTLENRAHETWLAARQSDRRCEEARAEATALRRKLTALAGGNVNEPGKPTPGLGDDLVNAPSPIHMESPGSPMLGRLPPPPFPPPPFMGPPPPFMGMPPPPPFVLPGEMRPAPLGRIMSPPPPQRPAHLDYEGYLDYEGDSAWHRHHTYSPPPRTYRSLSPTDSRYDYERERDLISTYDTETDFSPPPSPRESRTRGGGGGGYGSDRGGNSSRHPYVNSKKSPTGNKATLSSGSDKSYKSSPKQGSKPKSNGAGGGKSLV